MDVESQMVEVPAAVGSMPAFLARPKDGARVPCVLVIQEAFGLNDHIKDVARRIAGEGYVALAPDIYWRGGKGRTVRYDQLPEAIGLMQSLKDPEIVSDLGSAIAYLEKQPFVRADRIGITGFCMGGRVAYLAACELAAKIKASAPFYGGGIPLEKTPKLNCPVLAFLGANEAFISPANVEQLKVDASRCGKARADGGGPAYVPQIVPEPLLHIPRLTSIWFHPSLLARYRGGSPIAWQLIRGETESGVTVFWPDAGTDTGPILLQRSAPVGPDDTAGSLYYKTLYPLGVRAVLDAVALVREGRAPRVPQDESRASYDPLCRDEHARIDWSRPAAEVHNLIRGCDPQPGAHTVWRGAPLRLYEPRRVEAPPPAPPGPVLAIDPDGLTVAARDGALRCARARNGGAKAAAAA